MTEPSQRGRAVRPFLVMEILERAQALEASGRDIVHLEVGEPDFDTPLAAADAGIAAIRSGRTHYTHSMGVPALRDAIARHIGKEQGVEIAAERIVVTVGSSAAIQLAFAALCDPGDEIVVSDPGYACYPNIARTLGIVPRAVPVWAEDGFVYDPAAVEGAAGSRTRAIVVNSPANPTGAVTPRPVIERLAAIGIPIVSDEIYDGLVYEADAPSTITVSEDAFVVGGFSKRYAMTGWRLGWLVVPEGFVDVVRSMQQNLFISASDFGQRAAIAALDSPAEAERMRERFDERRRFLLDALPRIGLDVPVRPQGAFYVFCDARRYTSDSHAFAIELLERAGVAVTPGIDFGSRGEGWIRISYATSLLRIEEGIDRLGSYLQSR